MGKTSFLNPPLNELVFGVQFGPNQISQQNIFAFYNDFLKNEFPKIQENGLIPTSIERTDKHNPSMGINAGFQTRKLFINSANDSVIQVQPDKFLLNWRKHGSNEYPHFEVVYEKFKNRLDEMFLINSLLGKSINQYEITYVDHFPSEILGERQFNLSDVFTFFSSNQNLRNFNINFSISQPVIMGALNINARSALRTSDRKQVIVLETTCRGYNPDIDMKEWFNESRRILLDFFEQSMTEGMKSQWNPIKQ